MAIGFIEEWSRALRERRSRPFLEAAMAAAALVSTADRDVRLSEQLAVDEVAGRLEELDIWEPRAFADLHRRFGEAIAAHPETGRREALERVKAFAGDAHHGTLLVYVGGVVARADNDLSAEESAVLRELCETLGLPAEETLARIWPAAAAVRQR